MYVCMYVCIYTYAYLCFLERHGRCIAYISIDAAAY